MCSPSNLVPTLPPVRDFLHGSSLEESPISSPGDVNTAEREHIQPIASMARDCSARIGVNRSPTPLSRFGMAAQSGFESVSSGEDDSSYSLPSAIQLIPEGVKMPQSKFPL